MVDAIQGGGLPLRLPQELPDALSNLGGAGATAGSNSATGAGGVDGSFGSTLKQFLGEANQLQLHSDDMIRAFARGEVQDLHQVALAQQEAGIALRMVTEMRDRLLSAYQEIMRTPM
jgi:flagellar hook-basal body complex protein FliE